MQGGKKLIEADCFREASEEIAIRQRESVSDVSGAANQFLATSDDRLRGSGSVVLCGWSNGVSWSFR